MNFSRVNQIVGLSVLMLAGRGRQAHSQNACDPQHTFGECIASFRTQPPPSKQPRDAQEAKAKSTVEQRSTGGDAPSASGSSNLANYLPRLAAAVSAPGLSGDTASLGLNLNFPFNDGVLFNTGMRLQIAVVAHKPQLFAQLVDSIPQAQRDAVQKKLQGGLNDLDDAEITATLAAENGYFGRSFDKYISVLNRFADDITFPLDNALQIASGLETKALNSLKADSARAADPLCKKPTLDDQALYCYTDATRSAYLKAARATVAAQQNLTASSAALFHSTGFDRIADLVDNQPQISLAARTRNRRDIVGPSDFGGEFKLEWGFANLNRLLGFCHGTPTAACLSGFMNNPAVASSLARGDRVSLAVTAKSQPAYSVARKDTFSLALKSSWSVVPSVGYGFYLGKRDDGTDKGRLDFQAKHAWQLKDSQRQDQSVVQVTMTQPVSSGSSALFGLTWANKPEFLGTTDGKLRANVGFSYHLTSTSPK